MTIPVLKLCSVCNEEKDFSCFSKDKKRKDGLFCRCKDCSSKINKDRYRKDPDKFKKQSERWRRSNTERHRASSKAWAEKNPERVKRNRANNYINNLDRYKSYEKEYRQLHKIKIKDVQIEYYKNNAEKFKSDRKEYYRSNTDKVKAVNKAWQVANPEKYHLIKSKQRARKLNQTHINHDTEIERLLINKARLIHDTEGIKHHIDHIWPLSMGGPHHHDNLQVITVTLNCKKRNDILFTHPSIKTWVDLPDHILKWVRNNREELFKDVLDAVVQSNKYSDLEIDRLKILQY